MIVPRFIQDPVKGTTLPEEIVCYSLPYGGLGFISHVLTYYTMLCLHAGWSPIMPWKEVKHSFFDLALAVVGLLGGFALGVFTIVRCRNTWQLLLIAVWKLSMSMLNGSIGTHVAVAGFYSTRDDTEPAWWIILYIPGMVVGFVGLMSLVSENWAVHPHLQTMTYVFGGLLGLGPVVFIVGVALLCCGEGGEGDEDAGGWLIVFGTTYFLVFYVVVAAFYSDWAIGIMADNLLGVPSGDSSVLYWAYFASKRLTMFSF